MSSGSKCAFVPLSRLCSPVTAFGSCEQDTVFTHIRVLTSVWGGGPLPKPNPDALAAFGRRFPNHTALSDVTLTSEPLTAPRIRIDPTIRFTKSRTCLIEDELLEYIGVALARYGLAGFSPDYHSSPYFPYSDALRLAFIVTFRRLLFTSSFSWHRLDASSPCSMDTLSRFYNHVVFDFSTANLRRRRGRRAST